MSAATVKKAATSSEIRVSAAIPGPARLAQGAFAHLDYVDSYCIALPSPTPAADALLVELLTDLPAWVTGALRLRDRVVGVIGLQTGSDELTRGAQLPLKPGDMAAIFEVFARETDEAHDEVLIGGDDKHLNTRVSGLCAREVGGERYFAATTLVEYHNPLGWTYFLPVKPFHRLMMRALMTRLARKLEAIERLAPGAAGGTFDDGVALDVPAAAERDLQPAEVAT